MPEFKLTDFKTPFARSAAESIEVDYTLFPNEETKAFAEEHFGDIWTKTIDERMGVEITEPIQIGDDQISPNDYRKMRDSYYNYQYLNLLHQAEQLFTDNNQPDYNIADAAQAGDAMADHISKAARIYPRDITQIRGQIKFSDYMDDPEFGPHMQEIIKAEMTGAGFFERPTPLESPLNDTEHLRLTAIIWPTLDSTMQESAVLASHIMMQETGAEHGHN